MDKGPEPLADAIPEILCRLDASVLQTYQRLKRDAEKKRKETVNRYRREIGRLLRWKKPSLDRIEQLKQEADEELVQIAGEFQQAVRALVEGLVRMPENGITETSDGGRTPDGETQA